MRPAFIEVNLEHLSYNIGEIRKIVNPLSKIMAVVKANAYGHGALPIAKRVLASGADYLGVAIISEAIELREGGISEPILIFGWTPPEDLEVLIEYNLIQTIFNLEQAIQLNEMAKRKEKKAQIHIKIDTGMNRIGFKTCSNGLNSLLKVFELSNLEVVGIYTHFAEADNRNSNFTKTQFADFVRLLDYLETRGIKIPFKHCCNSAGLINYPEMHLNMVRPGIILYGLYPSNELREAIKLKPVMSMKARISHIKNVANGEGIGYGRTLIVNTPRKIATIPLGYADGLSRLLSNKGGVLVKNHIAPIVGNICMDQFMIDITDVSSNVNVGDEILLFGGEGADFNITVDAIAHLTQTINYEIVSRVGSRLPKIYI